jgi:hypothetical protein
LGLIKLEIEMTDTQAANSAGEADPKDVAETKISSAPEKDALGDSSLDKVSGGGWPSTTTKTGIVPPTI